MPNSQGFEVWEPKTGTLLPDRWAETLFFYSAWIETMKECPKLAPVAHRHFVELGRLFCFVVLSTIGMAAIGLALIAKPLDRYFDDREVIRMQQKQLEQLNHLSDQQEELLANVDNPGVLARAAVNNLNYVPAQSAGRNGEDLPPAWPELEQALDRMETNTPPLRDGWRRGVETLAGHTKIQYLLTGLGAALVVVSFTYFYKQP